MYLSKWRKYTISGGALTYWILRVGRFEAEVQDKLSTGDGYISFVNGKRVTLKFQRTVRQAKVVALLTIRRECKDVLELTNHMNMRY